IDTAFGLSASEHDAYQKNGFVISSRQSFSTFFAGYETIYQRDLPLYVSADSILHAVHRSYDRLLSDTEATYLKPTVESLLTKLRGKLASSTASDNAKHDVGLLLGVAAGLLNDKLTDLDDEMKSFISKAKAASGAEEVSIFGVDRTLDFSQFKPRGHYEGNYALEAYFRAMIWLGRTELRLVDVTESGGRSLVRREIEDVLALGELLDTDALSQWKQLDGIVGLFVGEADYMSAPQIQTLRDALGITSSSDLARVDDQKLLATIDGGNFGVQRIASQIMLVDDGMTTLPNSFALFGQRFTVDGEVMTKVVYPNTKERRMMPNPLDVAFAAFGNDQALPLLKDEINSYNYASSLGKARQLVEWHGPDYWESSMYTLWTDSLRQLSPSQYEHASLPAVARTEAWGRRILNAQLASWAELRHDTILYAKQSYTGVPSCEYPDGYVDPYPGFFLKLRQLGTNASAKLKAVMPANSYNAAVTYFDRLASVADRLATMATEELTGAPRTQADLDFLNDAVVTKTEKGCVTISYPSGWYVKLFYTGDDAKEAKPTIADVHTQPADESGATVGRILHVATGDARLMVVSVDSCQGPRAYAGLVSSYFEQITKDFQRLTDAEWVTTKSSAQDVPWMKDLVAR
ncbi:MAG TPA: DUF3160 domain-containing protein, partial [Polyangiaceae bacterium]